MSDAIAHRWDNPNADEVGLPLVRIPDFYFDRFCSLTLRSVYGLKKREPQSKVKVYEESSSGVIVGNLFAVMSIAELPLDEMKNSELGFKVSNRDVLGSEESDD